MHICILAPLLQLLRFFHLLFVPQVPHTHIQSIKCSVWNSVLTLRRAIWCVRTILYPKRATRLPNSRIDFHAVNCIIPLPTSTHSTLKARSLLPQKLEQMERHYQLSFSANIHIQVFAPTPRVPREHPAKRKMSRRDEGLSR